MIPRQRSSLLTLAALCGLAAAPAYGAAYFDYDDSGFEEPLSNEPLVLTLDFGTQTDYSFNQAYDLEMQYRNVANGVNATLTAEESFFDGFFSNYHGSVSGDIRIAAFSGSDINLSLQLWDANSGNGFDTAFDPGQDYEWTLGFYDIDSHDFSSGTWDEVTLITPGTYVTTQTTKLNPTTTEQGYVNLSGEGAGGVPGQSGLAPPITQEQADVAAIYTVKNTARMDFTYSVKDGGMAGTRVLLVDGGELRAALDQFQPEATPFPEPSAAVLLPMVFLMVHSAQRCRRRN